MCAWYVQPTRIYRKWLSKAHFAQTYWTDWRLT
ncbi:Uncharacterised protein [Vibrio cholerae]|nr:Uncharacterised protein [Vibrio cholerae]